MLTALMYKRCNIKDFIEMFKDLLDDGILEIYPKY